MLCLYARDSGKLTMPPVLAHNNAWPDDDGFVSVVAFDCLCVPVSDLRQSTGFYSELFAMRVVAGDAESGRVVLSRGGRIRLALALHARGGELPETRVAATVESLDAAREVIWNNGIATMHGGFRKDGRDGCTPTFAIADPDGHEIRFIEHPANETRGYAA